MDRKRDFSYKNIALLLQGQFVSNLGNQIFDIAVLLWIKELTGSAAIMGLVMLFTGLPEALLAPLGGSLSDRFGKVKILVASDVISGISLGLVLAACLLPTSTTVKILALSSTNLLLGMAAAGFVPTVSALVPSLVPERHLEKANAAHQFCGVGAKVIGQAAGGLIFAAFGVVWAFLLNAVSFLLSAVTESFIRVPEKTGPPVEPTAHQPSIMKATGSSMARVWRDRRLRRLVLHIGVFHLCLSGLPIVLPFLLEHRLKLGGQWFGFLVGAYTVGIMAGFVVAGLLSGFRFNRHRLIALSAMLVGVLFGLGGASRALWLTLAALVGIGTGIGLIIVNLLTELQIGAPEEERGRIMGTAQAVGGSSLPVGMALFGLLLDGLHRSGFSYEATTMAVLAGCGGTAFTLGLVFLIQTGREKTSTQTVSP